jgi:hypothetical protein
MRSILMNAIYQKKQIMQWNKTYSTIAPTKSAMERIPLHSWEMEFSVQYHVTINSQLNDQNSIRYYITQTIKQN